MRTSLLFIVILLGFSGMSYSSDGEDPIFQERPGVLEFSGMMIARPFQSEALAAQGLDSAQIMARREGAAARLAPHLVRYEPVLDHYIITIPDGLDENSFAGELMATGDYQYVEPNWICYPITTPNDPLFGNQWHHVNMKSAQAWDLYTGDTSMIATWVDTGVDKFHEDLAGHVLPGYNAVDRLTEAQGGDVSDVNGHGTKVAGCIGAIGNNGKGVAGVNWDISLMPVRASNSSGGGAYMDDLTHGALWAAQNGAKTISVSYTGVEVSAVGTTGTQIKNLDALLIWAAGNAGSNLSGFDWDDVIVAGASDQNDDKASFSNYGIPIDVMAPGVNVWTTQNGGGYSDPGGTSFSAPLTNGVCALAWAFNPSLTADEVEQALFDGCEDLGDPTNLGHGRVDVFQTLLLSNPAISISLPAGPPSGNLPPGPETVMVVKIKSGSENYVPGSGTLYYRFDSADLYSTVGVSSLGGDLYEAVMPNTKPGDAPEFYFSAQGDGGTTVLIPKDAPTSVYSFDVRFIEVVFSDNFEDDKGWTVQSFNITEGDWERAVPAGNGGARRDPPSDHDGSGKCWVTDNGFDADVDGGPTELTSPMIDLSSGDAEISYFRWHSNDDNDDFFTVEISNDNGSSWKQVEQVKDTAGWNLHSFMVSDFWTPTAQMKMRFSSADQPNDSVTESGLDAFSVEQFLDDPTLWADAYSISVATGGVVNFSLDAGPANNGRQYLLLASVTGTKPGTVLPGGAVLPLNWDVMTGLVIKSLGTPVFVNFTGNLDGSGTATATLNTLGPVDPLATGVDLYFAYFAWPNPFFTSNPITVTFVP